jgi:hypothetical protein
LYNYGKGVAAVARLFSIDEANAEVVRIRPLMAQIIAIRSEIMDKRPEVWSVLAKAASNGGNRVSAQVDQDFLRLQALIKKIVENGVEIKDIDTGLVDFRSLRDGREVYLCWKFGENQIQFWHELDAGFTGRQEL